MMRDLLFYSQHCKFSQGVLQLLHESGLLQRGVFTLVSVNSPGIRLPPFVDRVPLVYRHADRAVLVEDHLEQYVRGLRSMAAAQQQQQQPAAPSSQSSQRSELMAGYSDLQMDGKLSDTFGFLDESQHSPIENSSYGYLDACFAREAGGNAPGAREAVGSSSSSSSSSCSKPSRFDQKEYETYLSQRDADLNAIYSTRSK